MNRLGAVVLFACGLFLLCYKVTGVLTLSSATLIAFLVVMGFACCVLGGWLWNRRDTDTY